MGFFTWTFRRKIRPFNPDDLRSFLEKIDEHLIDLKVDKREVGSESIHFKNSWFNGQGNHHLMASVDKGEIILDPRKNELVYCISFKRMFFVITGMCSFFLLLAWNTPVMFPMIFLPIFWLFGMNFISARFRHSRHATKLKKLLDNTSEIA